MTYLLHTGQQCAVLTESSVTKKISCNIRTKITFYIGYLNIIRIFLLDFIKECIQATNVEHAS